MSSGAGAFQNSQKIFRTAILKKCVPMDALHFIKEHLWMCASDEVTLKFHT